MAQTDRDVRSHMTMAGREKIERRKFRSFLAAGFALAVAACWGSPPSEEEPVRPVKLIEVSSSDDVRTQSLPAVIEAARSSDLTFEISGTLQQLLVLEGDFVRQGQPIARLDPRTFQNSLASARAEFNNANAEFRRAERLVAEDAIARNVFEQRRTALEVARAQLDTARVSLSDTVLRAPFSGVIAQIHVERFENVGAQQEIVTLQTQGGAEAVVQVPATLVVYSDQIQPLESRLTLDAAPEASIPATFRSAATQADPSTQTFEARFNFQPPDGLLILPGMTGTLTAQLSIETPEIVNEGVSVPMAAILSDGEQRYVWLVNERTMTVARRNIVAAPANGETLLVTRGLRPGDTIVGAGASYLHEGMRVRRYED